MQRPPAHARRLEQKETKFDTLTKKQFLQIIISRDENVNALYTRTYFHPN